MEYKKFLTNEKINKKFNSQFELVNYAIKLAENMILSGREARVKTDSQNHALQVVAEISCNKDQLEEILEFEPKAAERNGSSTKPLELKLNLSLSEKKKTRKFVGG